MHPVATDMVVKEVRQRISEGDCPTIRARTVEVLEGAIEDLAARIDLALAGKPSKHDAAKTPMSKAAMEAADEIEKLRHALRVLLEEATNFSVSGVYFDEDCMGHKGPELARKALYP